MNDPNVCIASATIMDISPVNYLKDEFASVTDSISTLYELTQHLQSTNKKEDILTTITDSFSHDKSFQAFIKSNIKFADDEGGFRWSFNIDIIYESLNMLRDFPVEEESIKFNAPTFLLKGSNSNYIRSKHMREIGLNFPKYTLVSVKDAAHWLHYDKPEETTRMVEQFLRYVNDYRQIIK